MGLFRLLRREFLTQLGLIGRALNERLYNRGPADDEADREPTRTRPQERATKFFISTHVVATNLQGLQREFPDQQVRAVTHDGRLVDIRT